MKTDCQHIVCQKKREALIAFALREGWAVRITAKGSLIFKKSGCALLYTGSLLSDTSQIAQTLKQQRGVKNDK